MMCAMESCFRFKRFPPQLISNPEPLYQQTSAKPTELQGPYLHIKCIKINSFTNHQGPVVQSIVSLTSSLRGQLIKCFTTL